MDLIKAINKVRTLNSFVSLTHDIASRNESIQIPLNISTADALKNIRCFEFEYFCKHQETGLAFMILGQILKLPPSRAWALVGSALAPTLLYWLAGLRKYLIQHCHNWGIYLEKLLNFINNLRQKHIELHTVLVEHLAETLLDLATCGKLSLLQQLAVTCCLNHCSTGCTRATRQALADKLSGYFTKTAHAMLCCDHAPSQLASLELLMRWLLRRQERAVRQAAAARWLDDGHCSQAARTLFVESDFSDFFRDARRFLNEHNKRNGNVTSVLCRKITVGPLVVIPGSEQVQTWLDVNTVHGSITILLDPQILKLVKSQPLQPLGYETLTFAAENTLFVKLIRESEDVVISVQSAQAPEVLLGSPEVPEGLCTSRLHVTSRCHLPSLDKALSRAFCDKYKCSLELDAVLESSSPSPEVYSESFKRFSASEDDARHVSAIDVKKCVTKKRRRSGFVVMRRELPSGLNSPSTASTTSLLQLREKLSSLPRIRYEKEPFSVCALPNLSNVTELSEPEDSLATQRRSRAFGVARFAAKSKTSPSEGDEVYRYLSPEHKDHQNSPSGLHVATFGSNDHSLVNDSSNNTGGRGDIIELLFKEALAKKKDQDSGIITAEKDINNEKEAAGENSELFIENTPMVAVQSKRQTAPTKKLVNQSTSDDSNTEAIVTGKQNKKPPSKANKKTVIRSTSDESNTEAIVTETGKKPFVPANKVQKRIETSDDSTADAISQTQLHNYVTVRRRHLKSKKINSDANEKLNNIDVADIEGFFASHFKENARGELVISPTLARKINESSSDSSSSFDQYLISNCDEVNHPAEDTFEVNPTDILDCVNSIIDAVCEDINKCNEMLVKQGAEKTKNKAAEKDNKTRKQPKKAPRRMPKIKLAAKNSSTQKTPNKTTTKKGKGKLQLEPVVEVEATTAENILEDKENDNIPVERKKSDLDTPMLQRKKRKLYSPKDAEKEILHKPYSVVSDEEDIMPLAQLKPNSDLNTPKAKVTPKTTPKSVAISYKDIERERQKVTKAKRNRKSKTNTPILSPKTLKNNSVFDQLISKDEPNALRTVQPSNADIYVYNFTSDSEDDDFQKKKIVDLRKSATTLCSNESLSSRGRVLGKVNYTESSADEGKAGKKAKKGPPRRQPAKKRGKRAVQIKKQNMLDERMRDAEQKELDTSLNVEQAEKHIRNEITEEPAINCAQEMEPMDEVFVDEYPKETHDNIVQIEHHEEPIKTNTAQENTEKKTEEVKEIPTKKINKKKSELSLKKNVKDIKRKYTKLTEVSTEDSLLPALIIEKTASRPDDDLQSTTSSNLIKKCNRMIEEGDQFFDDTVATQNMLLDTDKVSYSPEMQDRVIDIELCEKLNVSKQKQVKTATKKTKVPYVEIENVTRNDVSIDLTATNTAQPIGTKVNTPCIVKLKEIKLEMSKDVLDKKIAQQKSKKTPPTPSRIIEITNDSDEDVEKSIATNGTRCDSDKVAPSLLHLEEQYESRNMELEQLSPSMQDYFLQLRAEISEAEFSGKQEKEGQVKRADSSKKSSDCISPVVSLKRLSYDDFKKWLPSPKSTETEASQEELRAQSKKVEDVKSSAIVTVEAVKELAKTRSGCERKAKVGAKTKKVKESEKSQSQKREKSAVRETEKTKPETKLKSKKNREEQKSHPRHISSISPIRLDDLEEEFSAEPIKTADFLQKIKEIFAQTHKKTDSKKQGFCSDAEYSGEVQETPKESANAESVKRSLSTAASQTKRRKVAKDDLVETVPGGSEESISRIRDWFTRDYPEKPTADENLSACRDMVENLLEKLDTTLVEIHQNTSRKIANMIVQWQAIQKDVEVTQNELFKDSIRETIKEISQCAATIMERRYKDIDERCAQKVEESKQSMRRLAVEVIREDMRQKRAMVTILHEDVQAVLKQLGNRRKTQ